MSHGDLLNAVRAELRASEQRTHKRLDGVIEEVGHVRTETARQAEMLTHHAHESDRRGRAISELSDRLKMIEDPVRGITWVWRVLLGLGALAAAVIGVKEAGGFFR